MAIVVDAEASLPAPESAMAKVKVSLPSTNFLKCSALKEGVPHI